MTTQSNENKAPQMIDDYILTATNIVKSFGGAHALKGASMQMRRGEITALIGDNGAGKSTMVRCLSGVYRPDSGEIRLDDASVSFTSPARAQKLGVETVQQNLALVEDLTVWQNFFLGREVTHGIPPFRTLNRKVMKARAAELLSTLAVNLPPINSRVRRLSGGQRQALAIARAAGWGSKIVIMDEPTAALGVQETERVESTIRMLRESGISILLISHNFDQVMRLSDHVWVMRGGLAVAERRTAETTNEEIVSLITGARTS